MASDSVFIFVGAYPSEADAKADYEVLRELHHAKLVGSYDSAIITKHEDGKVHVHKHEKPTQHAAWGGAAVGAVIGIVFPVSIPVTAAAGAVAGGLIGHITKGMSRHDLKEVGEALEAGEAALVVIGDSRVEEQLEKELKRAIRRESKEIKGIERAEVEAEAAQLMSGQGAA